MARLVKDCIDDARRELKEIDSELDLTEDMRKELLNLIFFSKDESYARNLLCKIINYYCSRCYTEGYIAGLSLLEAEECDND